MTWSYRGSQPKYTGISKSTKSPSVVSITERPIVYQERCFGYSQKWAGERRLSGRFLNNHSSSATEEDAPNWLSNSRRFDISRTRLSAGNNNRTICEASYCLMTMLDKRRFVESTSWLRPFTRWSTRFALNSPQWLPSVVRHAPLKLTSFVLRCYHVAMR